MTNIEFGAGRSRWMLKDFSGTMDAKGEGFTPVVTWLSMKLFAAIVLLGLVSFAGCVQRYEITLTNQRVITTHGKPKRDEKQGVVRFKDVEGRERVLPLIEVQGWAPR